MALDVLSGEMTVQTPFDCIAFQSHLSKFLLGGRMVAKSKIDCQDNSKNVIDIKVTMVT